MSGPQNADLPSAGGAGRREPAVVGIMEWFRLGEHERVEQVLADLKALGVTHLRTGLSWAEWCMPEGRAWYEWLVPKLAREVTLLPCCVYTPPSLGLAPKCSSPPRDPAAYGEWLEELLTRFDAHLEWIELWNEPNSSREWDVTLDPDWRIFSEMVAGAAQRVRQRGKRTVLGGLSPIDPNWLRLMFGRGAMEHIDAVGLHGFPGTYETQWDGWAARVGCMREVLQACGSGAELWITQAGFSTWRHEERRQLAEFVKALAAPVERLYWYSAQDEAPRPEATDGAPTDERCYHFGLKRLDGTPKLLYRFWASGGLEAVREAAWMGESVRLLRGGERPVLITGGAGFIGTNLAHCLLESGQPVLVFDNLSRPGVERNLRWLRERHGDRLEVEVADIRDSQALRRAVARASQVFHFAAQVAVTTSLVDPVGDFDVNARGTLELLEALRACDTPPPLVFTSTNKVYGALEDLPLRITGQRYEPAELAPPAGRAASGIDERRPLDFHSPYGCSKGAADQYVLDYARTFGLPAVVFRMSCIYGPHQFGTEDQGWVAHFLLCALADEPITLYGDGKQVRDLLYVDDLVDAFLLAQANMGTLSGQAFNIGGGPANTASLLEVLERIESLHGRRPPIRFAEWRPGDQRYYVSDTRRFERATGWSPRVPVEEGIRRLYEWLRATRPEGGSCEGAAGGRPAGRRPARNAGVVTRAGSRAAME